MALLPLALFALLQSAQAVDWPDISVPPRTGASQDGAQDVALVIAIEDYAYAQDVPGAVLNGRAWVHWLKNSWGVPLVKVLENGQATREEMLEAAKGVASRSRSGGRLWVVYIGHGAPAKGGDGVLVGADAQQTAMSLEARSVKMSELVGALEGPASEVVVVLDACFSGKSSSGDLAPGLAPLVPVTYLATRPKWTVLSAGRGDEYAGPLSDGTRPAFSYLVLGALRGWGDANRDGRVTDEEAVRYALDTMFETVTGRTQRPERNGAAVVLGRSGGETGPDLTSLAVLAPRSVSPGRAEVELGGEAVDFAALAAQAEAARRAKEEADRQAAEAQTRLEAERGRRLAAAATEVRASAKRDYDAISALVTDPTPEGRPVLEAWLARYGKAKVTVDGVTESVSMAEVARVEAALVRAVEAVPTPATAMASVSSSGRGVIEWVRIPAGSFSMGSDAGAGDEKPVHRVTVRAFQMTRTEVTFGQYRACVDAGACQPAHTDDGSCYVWNGSEWARGTLSASFRGDTQPVVCVDWDQATAFARWAGGRLPTEAEWEYAAKAGQNTTYAGSENLAEVGWYSENSGLVTHPVGEKKANAWGLYDMSGNVWEWVQDWYHDSYSGAPTNGSAWESPTGSYRVYRGGSWSLSARYVRVAFRYRYVPAYRDDYLGFRVSRSIP